MAQFNYLKVVFHNCFIITFFYIMNLLLSEHNLSLPAQLDERGCTVIDAGSFIDLPKKSGVFYGVFMVLLGSLFTFNHPNLH